MRANENENPRVVDVDLTRARNRVHVSYCPELGGCRVIGGDPGPGGRPRCERLDGLLNDLLAEAGRVGD